MIIEVNFYTLVNLILCAKVENCNSNLLQISIM